MVVQCLAISSGTGFAIHIGEQIGKLGAASSWLEGINPAGHRGGEKSSMLSA